MNTNPKKNRAMRRQRPNYGHNSFGRYTRTDGALVVREAGTRSGSIYTPHVGKKQLAKASKP